VTCFSCSQAASRGALASALDLCAARSSALTAALQPGALGLELGTAALAVGRMRELACEVCAASCRAEPLAFSAELRELLAELTGPLSRLALGQMGVATQDTLTLQTLVDGLLVYIYIHISIYLSIYI